MWSTGVKVKRCQWEWDEDRDDGTVERQDREVTMTRYGRYSRRKSKRRKKNGASTYSINGNGQLV